jgi:hypothetical protein
MLDFITTTISGFLALAFGFGGAAFIYKRHAEEWQMLAGIYGGARSNPQALKRFGHLVLYTDGTPARTYNGLLNVEIYSDGIGFKPLPLVMAFHDSIFVPYKDIKGWSQDWYINAKSVELQFAKAPDFRIIMPKSQLEWIKQESGRAFNISRDKPPHRQWPWATYAAALISGGIALSVIALGTAKYYGLAFG